MTTYEEQFFFDDYDADDAAERVAEPLRDESARIRHRERTEQAGIARRQLDRAWGRAVTEASMFSFSSTPQSWPEFVNGWISPEFYAQLGWLKRVRVEAISDGLLNQAKHAEHLGRLVTGETDAPHEPQREGGRFQCGDSVIASALANGYGLDPRRAFLKEMVLAGVIPCNPSGIGAGNVLHTFQVVGDAPDSANGWAILHRCPGAGSFGNSRTGAVHHWHSMPERMVVG